ncbi:MAG: AEC family transporter [Eubacteriales bacterium]|nr:AEC family transporter [Eubacteriales bacterium]
MEDLIFSLNATIPLFLTMVLGLLFRKMKLFNDSFLDGMNSFVFKVALPAALFNDLAGEDFFKVWDIKFVLFCFVVTLICISVSIVLAKCMKLGDETGEFAQASYRSSAGIMGIAFMENIYGNAGMAPLMIAAAVPLYNVMAVVILSIFKPNGGRLSKDTLIKTLKGIVTNPIILGIIIGMLWSILKLPRPGIMMKTVKYLANVSTPLGLMAVGASFEIGSVMGRLKPALIASGCKLVIWCAVFIPAAVMLGFTHEKLLAILVMLGSPTTVSCFIMAKNMGHKGTLTTNAVMITTLLSAFTLTGWVYLLRVMGLV